MGRLFDGVSSILGLQQINAYEGQAAMKLEFAAKTANSNDSYPVTLIKSQSSDKPIQIDWSDMLLNILHDLKLDISTEVVAAKFHNWLSDDIVKITEMSGLEKVVMSGGCFQNRYLLERSVKQLRENGFFPYWHQKIPPNDGGISLGQIVAAGRD
jgi:hydrogenase maturation protein HypF